jgi:hypothetical protein
MLFRRAKLSKRTLLASLALLAFTLRALIPAGFMPSGDGAIGLQICPDGFPVQLLAHSGEHLEHAAHHHHHDQNDAEAAGSSDHPLDSSQHSSHDHRSWSAGHCAFAAVASAPPSWHPAIVTVSSQVLLLPRRSDATPVLQHQRFRIAQPRGPPSLA